MVPRRPQMLQTRPPEEAPTVHELLYPGETQAVAIGQSSEDGTTSSIITDMATGEVGVEPKMPELEPEPEPEVPGSSTILTDTKVNVSNTGSGTDGLPNPFGSSTTLLEGDPKLENLGIKPEEDTETTTGTTTTETTTTGNTSNLVGVYSPDQTGQQPTEEPTSTYPGSTNFYTATPEQLAEGELNYTDQGINKNPKKRSEYKGYGGVGRTGGREAKYGRGKMVTGTQKSSILAP